MKRPFRSGLLSVALVAGIALFAYLAASFLPWRLDLTQDQIYSLSSGSRRLMKALEDPLRVRAFFSKGLPPPYSSFERYARSLLSEYRRIAGGRMKVEFVNPEAPEFLRKASEAGLLPLRFNVVEKERMEIREGYMGIVLDYRDRREVLPAMAQAETLEYDLSSRIQKLLRREKPVVGEAFGKGEKALSDYPEAVIRAIRDRYETERYNLHVETRPPTNLKAFLVVRPKEAWEKKALDRLAEMLEAGVSVGLFLDGWEPRFPSFWLERISGPDSFREFLGKFGLRLGDELIFDEQAGQISLSSRHGALQITNILSYPVFPLVRDWNRQHPAVKDMSSAVLPLVRAVYVEEMKPEWNVSVLARSSRYSFAKNVLYIHPLQLPRYERGLSTGPFSVLVSVSPASQKSRRGRLIVSGTSRIVEKTLPSYPGNHELFLNLLDSLAEEGDLISIRSKGTAFRALRRVEPTAQAMIRALNLFAMPLVFCGIGLARWRWRKKTWARRGREYRSAP